MIRFDFDDAELIIPKPVEGETYRETYDRLQLKRDMTIARHFLDCGARYGNEMDDETMADIIKGMDFDV